LRAAIRKKRYVKQYLLSLGALMTALAAFALPATADQPAAADQVAQAAAPSPSPSPTASPNPLALSGYADAGYDASSISGPKGLLGTRVFDNVAGVPQLNDVNFTAAYTGTIGGKIELNGGTDAVVFHSYPQNPMSICPQGPFTCTAPYNYQVDVTQAYPSFTFGKFTLIAGKFETLAGAEVIESPSDLDFSRSILFGYAVPFTHTGVRLTYAATPQLSLIVGANRGWDTTRPLSSSDLAKLGAPAGYSDNSDITAEFGLAYNPSSVFSLTVQGYDGQQEDALYVGCAGTASCNRSLIDAVGTYHVNSALTATVNVDDGQQTNTCSPSFASGTGIYCGFGVGTVQWRGIAGYLSEAWTGNLTTTIRYEAFGDPEGYRLGTGVGTEWSEGTFTAQYAPSSHLTLRGEWRVDTATQPIFSTTSPKGSSVLGTVGVEAIVHVP
jgi:hypothetical protein